MRKHYKAIFFIIGLAGIVLLVIRANPEGLDWKEFFTPRLLLLFAGLLLLWAVIYAVHGNEGKIYKRKNDADYFLLLQHDRH